MNKSTMKTIAIAAGVLLVNEILAANQLPNLRTVAGFAAVRS